MSIERVTEAAYREGFENGYQHGEHEWWCPPISIHFLCSKYRQENSPTPERDKEWLEMWLRLRPSERANVDWSWDCVFQDSGETYVCEVTG